MEKIDQGKPTKVMVGQRWNWMNIGRWRDITLIRQVDANNWEGQPADGSKTGYFSLSMLAESTYLGGPKEEPAVPKPAKGQRWRDNGTPTGFKVFGDEPFTLLGRHETNLGWAHSATGGLTYWDDECFTNGRLTFVDHGEQPAPPTVPTVSAPTCDRCGKPATVNSLCRDCDDWLEATYSEPKPRDLSALQPLATFTLPGDVAPQPVAYRTRTVTR